MLKPARTELVRIHILVVIMPIVALPAWARFGDSYHAITVVLLMGEFYLLPEVTPRGGT